MRKLAPLVAVTAALTLIAGAGSAVGYERPGHVVRIDVGAKGRDLPGSDAVLAGNDFDHFPETSMSGTGRWIAYATTEPLDANDFNGVSDVYVTDTKTGKTVLASHGLGGVTAAGGVPNPSLAGFRALSWDPSISRNGRYVAFASDASNLVPGDTNGADDVFVFDRVTGSIRRTSVSSSGAQANGLPGPVGLGSLLPSIDDRGDRVSFTSDGSNLVPNDTNSSVDVFMRDLRRHTTVRVSVSSSGAQSTGCPLVTGTAADGFESALLGCAAWWPASSISGDGRIVAFDSAADNLVKGDTNRMADVFVRDIARHSTERVSVASDGSQAELPAAYTPNAWVGSYLPGEFMGAPSGRAVSEDGRYVLFSSQANNLVPLDTNQDPLMANTNEGEDVFVHDRMTGRTERVSVYSDGEQVPGLTAFEASMTPDARLVVFSNQAAAGATKEWNQSNPIVADRLTGQIIGRFVFWPKLNAPAWYPDISSNGQFVSYGAHFYATQADKTNPRWHVFKWDLGPQVGTGGLDQPKVSIAKDAAFAGTDLVQAADSAADLGAVWTKEGANLIGATLAYRPMTRDLFVREELADMPSVSGMPLSAMLYGFDLTSNGTRYEVRVQRDGAGHASFQLYRDDAGTWTHVADLNGGYGTTGDEVVFALPIDDLGASNVHLSNLEAFTGLGTGGTGAVRILDSAGV